MLWKNTSSNNGASPSTGLNIIKTLGCLTAVTFFTVYNTYDDYNYNYDTVLAFLTFISTIATPLFFVVNGYMDAGSCSEGFNNVESRGVHCWLRCPSR